MNPKTKNYYAMTFGWGIQGHGSGLRHTRRAICLQLVGIFALLSILLVPSQSYARPPSTQVVQGRLIANGHFGPTPVAGVVVTLYNPQFGRSAQVVSRADGTFYFGSVPLGAYFVEVWLPHSPYPRTFKAIVNRMPVTDIGTFQLERSVGVQNTQGPQSGGWVQTGFY